MNTKMKKPRKKNVVAVLAGVAVAAAIASSAATLGGLRTDSVGANSNSVASPINDGVAVSWTTSYGGFGSGYLVDGVTLTTIGDEEFPAGAEVKVTLVDENDAPLGSEFVYTVGASAVESITLGPAGVAAADVYGVSVVVDGGAVTEITASTN